jgi:ketosteroid isomerase-like protein
MKKVLPLLCLALATIVPAPAQPTSPGPAAEAEAAINQLRTGLIDSFFKGDIDQALTYLAPDVTVTWQNGEVSRGHAEVRAYYQRMMTGPDRVVRELKAEPEIEGRHIHGDWAYSWGNLHDEFTLSDGRQLALNSRFTITTIKHGDRWLVTGYHASVNAFDNPILGLAIRKTTQWVGIGGGVAGLLAGIVVMGVFRRKAPAAATA